MQLLYLAIALLFISATCHADSCKVGPLYSCQNLDNVKECKSFDQCVPLWKQSNAVPYAATSFKYNCQFCLALAQDLKQLLQNNVTEGEIVKIVDELCLKLPTPNGKEMCAIMTNLYLKTALDMLAADIDPSVTCRAMRMCNGSAFVPRELNGLLKLHFSRTNALFKLRTNFANTSSYCSDCQAFLKDAQQHFKVPTTRAEVVANMIKVICLRLPHSLQSVCNETMELYADKVLILVSQNWDVNQMCNTLNYCHNIPKRQLLRNALFAFLTPHLKKVPARFWDNQCEFCQSLINNAKSKLTQPDAEKAIENLLKDQFCEQLASIKQECIYYVDLYLPILIEVLNQNVNALDVCRYLNACPQLYRFIPQFATKKPSVVFEANNKTRQPSVPSVKSRAEPCSFCLLLVKLVEKNLNSNRTREEIEYYLDEICNAAGQEKDVCRNLVKQYGDMVVELLLQYATPEVICQTIGICSSQQSVRDRGNILFHSKESRFPGDFLRTCLIFVRKAQLLQRASNRTMSIQSMQLALSKMCADNLKSPADQEECRKIIVRHVAALMIALRQNRVVPGRFCQDIIRSSDPLLGRQKCSWGPAYWCSSLSNANECNALPHCQARVWKLKPLMESNQTRIQSTSSACDLCKLLSEQAYNFLRQNKTEQELETFLDSVCTYLPDTQQDLCRTLIKQYVPVIVDAFEKEFSTDQLCQALDLCPKTTTSSPRLLGANRCTRGPGYWCQGLVTAYECKALPHCRRVVWKGSRPM